MVIPTYTLTPELEEMAEFCALTYRSQVDELIITEDGGNYSETLKDIADIYIFNKHNEGFTRNVNKGWSVASGGYTMIANSDTQLISGSLKDLCIPNKVTCPITHTETVPYFWGAFFCVPKNIKKQYGLLKEDLPDKNYGSDSEYEKRIGHIYQPIQTVEILHALHKTTDAAGIRNTLND